MIDRDKLLYIKNILSLHNDDVDLTAAYNIMTSLKEKNTLKFLTHISNYINSLHEFKTIGVNLLEGDKEGNLYQFYTNLLKLTNRDLDRHYLENVLSATRKHKDREKDILDSFSPNQMIAKKELLTAVDNLGILDKDSTVIIWGCWYGSILIPYFQKKVKKIIGVDIDNTSIKIAQNTFFKDYDNIEFTQRDVFSTKYKSYYLDANLIINTSCEHMPPMKEWPWFRYSSMEGDTIYPKGYADDKPNRKKIYSSPKLSDNCYFAFQSNNMFGIEGHINCVNSIEEFKDQMPERAHIMYEEEIEDTRGTRYMLVGKFNSL